MMTLKLCASFPLRNGNVFCKIDKRHGDRSVQSPGVAQDLSSFVVETSGTAFRYELSARFVWSESV